MTETEFMLVRVIGCSTPLTVTVVVVVDSKMVAGRSGGIPHEVVQTVIVSGSAASITTCVVAISQPIVCRELEQSLKISVVSLGSQVTSGMTALTTGTDVVTPLIVIVEVVVDSTNEPSIPTGRAHEVVRTTPLVVPTEITELPYVQVA